MSIYINLFKFLDNKVNCQTIIKEDLVDYFMQFTNSNKTCNSNKKEKNDIFLNFNSNYKSNFKKVNFNSSEKFPSKNFYGKSNNNKNSEKSLNAFNDWNYNIYNINGKNKTDLQYNYQSFAENNSFKEDNHEINNPFTSDYNIQFDKYNEILSSKKINNNCIIKRDNKESFENKRIIYNKIKNKNKLSPREINDKDNSKNYFMNSSQKTIDRLINNSPHYSKEFYILASNEKSSDSQKENQRLNANKELSFNNKIQRKSSIISRYNTINNNLINSIKHYSFINGNIDIDNKNFENKKTFDKYLIAEDKKPIISNSKENIKEEFKQLNKRLIFKQEKVQNYKKDNNEAIKSVRENFLVSLNFIKNDQPIEIQRLLEEVENYVNNKKVLNEENFKEILEKRFSMKKLTEKKENSSFDKFENSAKGRFFKNFLKLNSNDDYKRLIQNLNASGGEVNFNSIQSPSKFFLELIGMKNNDKNKNNSTLMYEAENSNLVNDFLIEDRGQRPKINSKNNEQFNCIINNFKNEFSENQIEQNDKNDNNYIFFNQKLKINNIENRINYNSSDKQNILKKESNNIYLNKSTSEIPIKLTNLKNLSDAQNKNNVDHNCFHFLGIKPKFFLEKKRSILGNKGFKYRMFNSDDKRFCLDLLKIFDLHSVAKFCNIPIKSLKRWTIMGPERKKGGGRKTRDPEMETKLILWINEQIEKGILITTKMIKEKALELTKIQDFLASKGWFVKFQKKYNFKIPKKITKNYKYFGIVTENDNFN